MTRWILPLMISGCFFDLDAIKRPSELVNDASADSVGEMQADYMKETQAEIPLDTISQELPQSACNTGTCVIEPPAPRCNMGKCDTGICCVQQKPELQKWGPLCWPTAEGCYCTSSSYVTCTVNGMVCCGEKGCRKSC